MCRPHRKDTIAVSGIFTVRLVGATNCHVLHTHTNLAYFLLPPRLFVYNREIGLKTLVLRLARFCVLMGISTLALASPVALEETTHDWGSDGIFTYYNLTNNSSSPISIFAVSSTASIPRFDTTRSSWWALSLGSWAIDSIRRNDPMYTWADALSQFTRCSDSDCSSYTSLNISWSVIESLLSTGDQSVGIFWRGSSSDSDDIQVGESTHEEFYVQYMASSEYAAWGSDGQLLYSSVTAQPPETNIPEPAPIVLLGLGLIGLLAFRRQ